MALAQHAESEFEKIQKEVLQKLESDDNDDYVKLDKDPATMRKFQTALKKTYDELKKMVKNTDSLENALEHLSSEHKDLIQTTFNLQSFEVDMQIQPDDVVVLKFASLTETPLAFTTSEVQVDSSNYEKNSILLKARILYEVVALALNLVGFVSSKATAEAIDYITSILSTSANILGEIDRMIKADGDRTEIGKAIVSCLIELLTYPTTPMIKLVKLCVKKVDWVDIILAVGQVLCFIATMISSAGAAALAKVISLLMKATAFIKKLQQMHEFQSYQ